MYDRMGATIALGTDWTASGSVNMLRELKCAENWNNVYWNGYFSDADLVAMATHWSAELMGFEDVLGSLLPGRVADITIWNAATHSGYRAVLDAEMTDVTLVMRSGKPLYGDTALVTGLAANAANCEALSVCSTDKSICAKQETTKTVATLRGEAGGSPYDLFFCGTPTGEPSCTPLRPGEFDGMPSGNDGDGDGVDDDVDNCVGVFNPAIPLDNNLQADSDNDDVGDACDPCPLAANTTSCPGVNPNDRDGDTILNTLDNCPDEANLDQADSDGDDKGDLCDACPNDANPGAEACPASIYAIKHRTIAVGAQVTVQNAIVTAVGAKAIFVQVDPADPTYDGAQYSGVYVFTGSAPTVAVGNSVNITGAIADFHGGLELDRVTITKTGEGPFSVPATVVSPADIAPGGSLIDAYEAVLVAVQNVTVLDTTPVGETGEIVENEFLVTGNLSVDDGLYAITPAPSEGQAFPAITGVLRYTWNRDKLWPRNSQDLQVGPPVLASFGPAVVNLQKGQIDASSAPKLLVTLSHSGSTNTFVAVTSADEAVVTVTGDGVTIPAGQTSAEVLLSGIELGTDVLLTATLDSLSFDVTANVWDPTLPAVPVSLTPQASSILVSQTQTYTVTLDHPAPNGGQLVTINTTGAGLSAVPASVLVPQGSINQSFDVTAGAVPASVQITATVNTTTVMAALEITETPPVGVLLAEVLYDPNGVADSNHEWIKLYNGTGSAVDLANYSLAWAGAAYGAPCSGAQSPNCVLQLTGIVAPGACFLVGGPNSVAANASPTLNQAVDLNPDLENSGSDQADAVALFHMTAGSITGSSLPIDVVLYGSVNDKGFKGPDGNASPVHVGDAPAGSSIKRTAFATWVINATPTPNICTPIQ